ncbi:MAG TPA: hypothetical protein VKZ89_18300 [Thermobifida alba]|nr:hypothetical protein [Thermobifida alba]
MQSGTPPPCACRGSDVQALLRTTAAALNPPPAAAPWERAQVVTRRADRIAAVLELAGEVSADILLDAVEQAAAVFPTGYREAREVRSA